MPRTTREIKMNFRDKHDLLIPAGQPVSKCKDDTGEYFVENFASFIDERSQAILFHDATHYGIRVSGADVTESV